MPPLDRRTLLTAAGTAALGGVATPARTFQDEKPGRTPHTRFAVNVVAPGLIDTEMIKDIPLKNIKQMIPMARIGKPEEVAKTVSFLCSDDASYITGQVIAVNGGMC